MTKTLYVGNLPWSMTEADLTAAFEPHGQVVTSRIITEKGSGRSKGFGFVEVEDDAAANMVKLMNGFQLAGRPLIVNEARPKQDKEASGTAESRNA
jgi:RNA recognition motif-containing protein